MNFLRTIQLRATRVSRLTADIRRFFDRKNGNNKRCALFENEFISRILFRFVRKKLSPLSLRAPVVITRIELNSAQRCLLLLDKPWTTREEEEEAKSAVVKRGVSPFESGASLIFGYSCVFRVAFKNQPIVVIPPPALSPSRRTSLNRHRGQRGSDAYFSVVTFALSRRYLFYSPL